MGLASALSTALTGLSAAETTIDLVGNNLANSNTVGFKSSEASFATQYLQTTSLGSSPTDNSGGTNPVQLGLGAMVADTTPDFEQGTIEISSNTLDMAISGEGFFMVEGSSGEILYTRNGEFETNADYELVTLTGNRVLGYSVDDNYQVQETSVVPLEIPLGAESVAEATENVYLEGTLTPDGVVGDTASIIQTSVLGDGSVLQPTDRTDGRIPEADTPDITDPEGSSVLSATGTGGMLAGETYVYRYVWASGAFDPTEAAGTGESSISNQSSITVSATSDSIDLTNLPDTPWVSDMGVSPYTYLRIYRQDPGSEEFVYLDELEVGTDDFTVYHDLAAARTAEPTANEVLDDEGPDGLYYYYVTYCDTTEAYPAGAETRPSTMDIGPITADSGDAIVLSNLPYLTAAQAGDTWKSMRIYRSLASEDRYYYVGQVNSVTDPTSTYTDNKSDEAIALDGNLLDFDGPKISKETLLTDVISRDGTTYSHVFEEGTLTFSGTKGDRTLSAKTFEITDETTVADLIAFMEEAMGIAEPSGIDPALDVPGTPGGWVDEETGRINLMGNYGEDNSLDIKLSGMKLTTTLGTETVNLPWATVQEANGESCVTDFIVYDSLGTEIEVRLTLVLQETSDTATVYRWFADSADNLPLTGSDISVGTGLVTFDGEGNFVSCSNDTVSIERRGTPASSPLEFKLDFASMSGLAAEDASVAVSRQDGSAPGSLTSYIIGEDGIISGVFSNGVTRTLGQILLARFANPSGLEQLGENLYSTGVNSGLPVVGTPGENGIGAIVSGARELSNTDIGGDLIELILASTMYRGNTRVITTSQEMLDELLSIRR